MAVGLCWLPLRHPHARPSSSTLPGHDTPNPSTHSQQPDPGCVDHPVAPHCHPNTMVQTGGKTPRSQVPSGPAAIDTITPTAPNAVTTPPPARGLGGHPWSYNASSLVFFLGECKTTSLPLSRVPTPRCSTVPRAMWLPPPLHSLHRNGPMWVPPLFCGPPIPPPLLKTGHPTLHTLSLYSPHPPHPVRHHAKCLQERSEAAVDAYADPDANAGSAE